MDSLSNYTYDAIVVGSGISGGWAAMELSKKGLKTLILERGRNVEHIKDYPNAMANSWDFPNRFRHTDEQDKNYPIQKGSLVFSSANESFFVNDLEHPYTQVKPFTWIRGYQVGGRSLIWGRQCYRLSEIDFEANLADGIGVDWPIRYKDLEPWYNYTEAFVGVSGQNEGIKPLPDGNFLPAMPMNCIEDFVGKKLKSAFPDRIMTPARLANLSIQHLDRGPCQYRNLCARGCPYGGYFSSNSATIPAGLKTGNLTLRPFSIVTNVIYDPKTQKASGVEVLDAETKQSYIFKSKILFLNASTLGTTQILLNSKSSSFPSGLGNSSGQIGHNLMDHVSGAGAYGDYEGFLDQFYTGRKPGGTIIPRFQNLKGSDRDYLRGFGLQGRGRRIGWERLENKSGIGTDFKSQISKFGPWNMWLGGWGEFLPYFENHVKLDPEKKDVFGQPILSMDSELKDNEKKMLKDMEKSAKEILELCGFTRIRGFQDSAPPGSTIHEMGTARMGKDPKTSVLNGFNQMHDVKNIFITDGSCMTSSGSVNPSLTYMALTARACDFAFNELKKGNL